MPSFLVLITYKLNLSNIPLFFAVAGVIPANYIACGLYRFFAVAGVITCKQQHCLRPLSFPDSGWRNSTMAKSFSVPIICGLHPVKKCGFLLIHYNTTPHSAA